jgi:hypothetical protein
MYPDLSTEYQEECNLQRILMEHTIKAMERELEEKEKELKNA